MRKTFPLPQLLAGSKRATSAAASDCAAHSRQLRSLSRLRLLRGVALHHTPPLLPLSGVGGWAGSRLGNWGPKFHPREFFESSTRANGGTEKGPPKNVAEAWCCAVCVANTLINHNNGLPGKNLVTVASHTPDGFGVLIQSSEVACFMHPSVWENRDATPPVIVLPLPIGGAGVRYHGF